MAIVKQVGDRRVVGFRMRVRAFGTSLRWRSVSVDSDGVVRVFDEKAGYYTRCHGLTDSAQKRLRKHAEGWRRHVDTVAVQYGIGEVRDWRSHGS
jgi:hypothetical protein